jgi:hypothetical protein
MRAERDSRKVRRLRELEMRASDERGTRLRAGGCGRVWGTDAARLDGGTSDSLPTCDQSMLIGTGVSWWGARSVVALDEVEVATLTDATLKSRRERAGVRACGVGGWPVRRDGLEAWRRRGVRLEEVTRGVELRSAPGTQEPEVANLGKVTRQHMLEEALDERVDREREVPCLLRACVGVAEGDVVVVEPDEPRIGEGDVKDIAGQIPEGMVAMADLLEMDGPPPIPRGGGDLGREAGLRQGVSHLRAE